jgi:hypothetical protein
MSVGPTNRLAGFPVGRTHLSGTAMSLVGGDPGVPMSHMFYFGSKRKTVEDEAATRTG